VSRTSRAALRRTFCGIWVLGCLLIGEQLAGTYCSEVAVKVDMHTHDNSSIKGITVSLAWWCAEYIYV